MFELSAIITIVPIALATMMEHIGDISAISAVGIRNVVENQVDFTQSRNLIISAAILVSGLGFNSVGGIQIPVGSITISLSGLAIAAIAGILLNAILPGNDYPFGEPKKGMAAVCFKV